MNKPEKPDLPLTFYDTADPSTKLEAENEYIPELKREVTEQKDGDKYIYYEVVKQGRGPDGEIHTSTRKLPGSYDMPLSENPQFEPKEIEVVAKDGPTTHKAVYFRKLPDSGVTDLNKYRSEKEKAA